MATSTSWLQAAKATVPSLLSSPQSGSQCRSRSSRKAAAIVPRAEQKETTETEVEVENPSPKVPESATKSDFKGGRFAVRSDMIGAVLGGAVNIPFRFGSSVFVRGYNIQNRPAAEVAGDKYAIPFAGRKFVEVANPGPRPEKPIEIYEFEGCPFCRKVREIVSILDIDVLYYPCPKNGPNFRPKANQLGGKKQFPYMVDPNTNVAMYESDDIIKYLVEKYGDGKVPLLLNLGVLTTLTAGLALIGRFGKGSTYVPSKLPEKPLELWAYEPSPFCKIAREALSELELPHIYHSCARGSAKRDLLLQKTGRFQVPYLEDPNTGSAMFECHDIVEYVRRTYALARA